MTVKSKKRRLKRARAHQAQCKGRDQFHAAFSNSMPLIEKETNILELQAEYNDGMIVEGEVVQEPPARAKCPSCGTSQKVRKDGTLGKHSPTRTDTSECIGSGKPWNADV